MMIMKKLTNIFLNFILLISTAACSNELPFKETSDDGEGRILTSSLIVDVKTEEKLVRAETGAVDVKDVTVDFVNTADPDNVVLTYTYGHMPEVVTLPVGEYMVKAYYGGYYGENNSSAAFNKPYYYGESEEFSVEKDKITDNIEPIVCKLSNVKVTILFDQGLVNFIDEQAKVSVRVGESGMLDFYPNTEDCGYFEYVDGSSTLVAEFTGSINGDPTSETKTYDNVNPGNHYRITFKLHKVNVEAPGGINPGEQGNEIKVDATVNLKDLRGEESYINDPEEEIYLEDDRYNNVDPEPGPDDPVNPPTGDGPTITAVGAVFGQPNKVADLEECAIEVSSETGITSFLVKIDSDTLTPEELESVGLVSEFDLVNPGDLKEILQNLGFLDKETDQESLKGEKDVKLDISDFLGLLQMLGAGTHNFIVSVGDSSGVTIRTLILVTE